MSWGNRLLIVFVVFAGLMLTMVYLAVNTKFELVTKDYYKEELRYQDKIDGVNNANKLSAVAVSQDDSFLLLNMPQELKGLKSAGEIWFYCSNDETKDKKLLLELDESGRQVIKKDKISKGNYQMKLTWTAGGNAYYHEQMLTIN